MKRIFILKCILIYVVINSNGQVKKQWGADFNWDKAYFENDNEFESKIIKHKKVKKAYLINTYGNRDADGFAEFNDTISIYHFNKLGEIIDEYYYDKEKKSFYSVTNYKKSSQDSSIYKFSTSKTDSTVFKYEFKNYGKGYDTAFIYKTIYNKNGKIIEYLHSGTTFFLNSGACRHASERHYSYNYDKNGRLIYYQDYIHRYCKKISYTEYGKKIETIDFKSNKITDTEYVLINDVYDELNNTRTITETDRNIQITKSFENGLLRIKSTESIGFFPSIEYTEYFYEYF